MRRWLALVYTLGVTGFLLVGPAYSSRTTTIGPRGSTVTTGSSSLLDHEGPSVLLVLAIPLLLSAAPLVTPRRYRYSLTLTATVLLLVFVFIAGFSIGYFYAPAVIALAVATDASSKGPTDGEAASSGVERSAS